MDKVNNMLTEFLRNNGQTALWVIETLELPSATLSRPTTTMTHLPKIERLFKQVAKKVERFRFSSNHVQDFDYLKNECGVMHNHLGRLIGYKVSGKLNWRLQRGLSPEEQATILTELSRIAQALKSYRVADEQQRAA